VPVLVGIGLAGGLFSALFGVGGGLVLVPLLILFAGFDGHEATATSLAVIAFTAIVGAATYGALGEVDWGHAALVGLPAVAGTIVGTTLQQRIASRTLLYLFSAFILAVAVALLVE
jgi:uncharacterized membrane protein YfcA